MTPGLNLHAIELRSRANGPGVRTVLWVQGCSLGCPGCFNPQTHADETRNLVALDDVMDGIRAEADTGAIEGITISGGEPLQQPEAVLALLERVRGSTALSVVVFSGYTVDEIRSQPLGPRIVDHIDVLIDGRYESRRRTGRNLRGSGNQRIHTLTDRYTIEQIEATPEAEIRIDPSGNVVLTGVNPLVLK